MPKKLFFCFVVVIAVTYAPCLVGAAPDIESLSGTIADGAVATIEGSDFGTKTQASPLKWDDFEQPNYSVGDTIANGWNIWTPSSTCYAPVYSDANNRLGSSKHIRCNFGDGHYKSVFYYDHGNTLSPCYVTFRFRRNKVSGTDTDNEKFFKVLHDPSGLCSPQVSSALIGGSGVTGTNGGHCGTSNSIFSKWHSTPSEEIWYRYEGYFVESAPFDGTANGTVELWMQAEGAPFSKIVDYVNNTRTNVSGETTHWRSVLFGEYVRMASGRVYTHDFDNIYIDNTQQRVELGNASTWSSCTHREIQIPSAWSDNSISITVNQGTYQEGQSAYLFVIDSNGNRNTNGYPVVIGGGSGDNPPSVSITAPTAESTYTTSESSISIAGSASDDSGISTITWSNNRGGSGTANNDSGDWTSWSVTNLSLEEDENVITVTATDSATQTSTDTIVVTYSESGMVQAWSATEQTGDPSWGNSGITYCVRLLIEGNHVTQSGNTVTLGFQGRSSGDYTIRKVSIAERDTGGAEGDVVDSSWTKVTFDGNSELTWATDVMTVVAGSEKLSDPIPFVLHAGNDYYVTFKIVTPSVYLSPPSYRELYFESADHTEDIDWSGNGHGINLYFHAAASMYVVEDGGDTTDPTVTISSPTSQGAYSTEEDTVDLGGSASDNVGVTSVTWTNSRGGSGTASGTESWTIPGIPLHCGDDNVLTVTAEDAAVNSATDTLTIDVKPCTPLGFDTQ